jgi:hypothetical protein
MSPVCWVTFPQSGSCAGTHYAFACEGPADSTPLEMAVLLWNILFTGALPDVEVSGRLDRLCAGDARAPCHAGHLVSAA